MNITRTIKPENWLTLATTVYTVFGESVAPEHVTAIRDGKPTEQAVAAIKARAERVRSQTYNGAVFHQCNSILETLKNYGLIG